VQEYCSLDCEGVVSLAHSKFCCVIQEIQRRDLEPNIRDYWIMRILLKQDKLMKALKQGSFSEIAQSRVL
jgi:hypothetical protein